MIRFELNKGRCKIKVEEILKRLERIVFSEFKKSGVISVAFVSEAVIKRHNQTYRRKDRATDILTFVMGEKDYLGEILLSPKNILRRAKKMDKTLKEAVAFLLVHGVLHIMGYVHKKNRDAAEMEKMEKKLLKKLDI